MARSSMSVSPGVCTRGGGAPLGMVELHANMIYQIDISMQHMCR